MATAVPADLAKEFRSMLMRVAQQLSEDEMTRIAYEEGFTLELPPGSVGLQDMRVLFLHKLEAKGVFSTQSPDGFASILRRLDREDLQADVTKYKQHPLFGKGTRKRKKPKEGTKTTNKRSELKIVTCANTLESLQEMYALAMTHTTSMLSVLEELRELMQKPLPKDKLEEVVPQMKEVVVLLSKNKSAVETICEGLKKSGAELPSPTSPKSSTTSRGTHEKSKLKKSGTVEFDSIHPATSPKKPLSLTLSLGADTKVGSQEPQGEYSEIVSMSTLQQAYATYDQLPVRRNALQSNVRPTIKAKAATPQESYVNVPPREEEFYASVPPRDEYYNVSTKKVSYENVATTPTQVEDVNYDVITDETDVDENNYGVVRHSDSGIGTGSGGAEPREWLPHPKTRTNSGSSDELVSNPMYDTQQGPQMRYMKLLPRPEAEGEDSIYTDPVRPPAAREKQS